MVPYPQINAPTTLHAANGIDTGPVKKPAVTLVITPTSAPHHGPIVIATTAVPIISKKIGSFNAPATVPPITFKTEATGTNAITYVNGTPPPVELLNFSPCVACSFIDSPPRNK